MARLSLISETIWDTKYRYRLAGQVIDQTLEATWQRVAAAIAAAEPQHERANTTQQFYQILEDFKFLPGGRILAGAGTHHQVTLFNCFVMNIAEDSLTGIFDALKEGALTLQQGGGVGYDFSVLRPQGDDVKTAGIPASGPVSFMRVWDTMCSVMLSTGARRGAMMGVLRCDHPDILSFIAAKRDARELRHFNVSVMVTADFIRAVLQDEPWPLVFPIHDKKPYTDVIYRQWGNSSQPVPCAVYERISARKLWETIIRAAYDYAEPGVLFLDTINRNNTLWYREQINATNPCGEIPLPPYGACDLGAINLTQFVIAPFSPQAAINWQGIEEVTHLATRFLDNVIDVSNYPLPAQREQAFGTRRIGLGVSGLADLFVMMGLRYGEPASIQLAREIMQRIAQVTWQTSIDLAKTKGAFPFFEKAYLEGQYVQTLDANLQAQLAKYGVRNSHHNTIAPTGTISLLANNISNGIEPIFHAEYDRHVRMPQGNIETFRVKDYSYHLWQQQQSGLPPAWMDTNTLQPDAHLVIQGAMQPCIDNAISKTINIPAHFPFEDVMSIYMRAYELGLKGCTIFRPNPVTGSVLEVPEEQCCQLESGNR